MDKIAFIVGNGPSREVIDIEVLKTKGIVWGCNALYRDVAPHFLVAVDDNMQKEIYNAGYHENNKVYFKKKSHGEQFPPHPNITIFHEEITSPNNSGMSAIFQCIRQNYTDIYLIGFDISNIVNPQDYNVYKNTPNYKDFKNRTPKIVRGVLDKISEWTQRYNETVRFTRVIDDTCYIPDNRKGFEEPYLYHISYQDFVNRFGEDLWKTR